MVLQVIVISIFEKFFNQNLGEFTLLNHTNKGTQFSGLPFEVNIVYHLQILKWRRTVIQYDGFLPSRKESLAYRPKFFLNWRHLMIEAQLLQHYLQNNSSNNYGTYHAVTHIVPNG